MRPPKPRIVPVPEGVFDEDPIPALLSATLPHGDPWSWLLALSLFQADDLARRMMNSSPAGLARLLDEDLSRLRELRSWLQKNHALSDLGCREASEAEWEALEVLERGNAEGLAALFRKHGYAPFSCQTAFTWNGELAVVQTPDPADISVLVGYEKQLKMLLQSVSRLMKGKPAASVLLYGARGTGKSTAVKALRTLFGPQGLRLVEIMPEGLASLSELMNILRGLPQKFVLYIDDLAYDSADRGWRKIKAILDGAVWARPENVMLIATSNRKNIVGESWDERPDLGAEPAAWDSLQEKLALADRFALQLTFPPFDKKLYLRAVARHLGLDELDEAAKAAALRFAIEGHGFSGRTAKQFADSIS